MTQNADSRRDIEITLRVTLYPGSSPDEAADEVFDIIGNTTLDHIDYVLGASHNGRSGAG